MVAVVEYDPIRDKSYRHARLGPDVAAFLAWYELGGARPTTLENAERALAVVCRMYPNTPVDEVTDSQLSQVFKRFPARGRRTRVAPYRKFFKWAVLTRRIPRGENPMEMIPTMRAPQQKQHDIFTDAEIDMLLGLPVVDAAPMALLFDAGLRRSECQALQVRHCLPESGNVKVIDGKGGKDRVIPMSARVTRLLADLILLEGLSPADFVFYGVRANGNSRTVIRDHQIGEGTFSRWWQRCLKDAGVRYRNPHEARHTMATRWKRRGLAAEDIAIIMGHESVRTTVDLYFHIQPGEVAERMASLEAAELERV